MSSSNGKPNLLPVLRLFILVFVTFTWLTGCQGRKLTRNTSERPSEAIRLQFDAPGKFRIAQFTDIHWTGSEPEQCAASERVIRHVLETERPHLAVLTGDIVIAPQEAGWKAVMALFTEAHVPVAVTLGNHDDEAEWTRAQIFSYLSTFPDLLEAGTRRPLRGGELYPGNPSQRHSHPCNHAPGQFIPAPQNHLRGPCSGPSGRTPLFLRLPGLCRRYRSQLLRLDQIRPDRLVPGTEPSLHGP